MKKQLITTSIIIALAAAPVMASSITENTDNDSAAELIGFSTGAIIGGLIAGPIGIVAAGTIGVIIGQSHDRKEQKEIAEYKLEKNTEAMHSLQNEKHNLQNRLNKSENKQGDLINQLALSNRTLKQVDTLEKIKLNLRFEVDSSKVESFYQPQIKHLAMLIEENPKLSVSLSGFADSSGSDDTNLKLSEARTQSVKAMLLSYGVKESQVFTKGFGESLAKQQPRSQSNDFNNRKVEVELVAKDEFVSQPHILADNN